MTAREGEGLDAEIGSSGDIAALGGWAQVLGRLFRHDNLSASEASAALDSVLAGEASPTLVAAFLAALRTKGETVEEISGLVNALKARAEPLTIEGELVDTCGTGGDRSSTINVSTISALVVAAAGARVCKHGNRAASSAAGSADMFEALGVVIDLGPAGVARCVARTGIGFCFAPRFHPAMRYVAPVRSELGVATVFNFLGPLANPAAAKRQLIGIGDPAMAERMLAVLEASGTVHSMIVFGHDGLDELSTVTTSTVLETIRVADGPSGYERRSFEVDPCSYGLGRAALADLQGGGSALNAELAAAVLAGERGPRREFVLLNAGAALVVAGLVDAIDSGIELAASMLDSGKASATLEQLVSVSQSVAVGAEDAEVR